MSHTTTVKSVQYADEAAIRAAVDALQQQGVGISLLENSKPRMYYENQQGRCDFVLKLNGQYDVGLVRQHDGSYLPVFDEWGGHVAEVIGTGRGSAEQHIGRFTRAYSEQALRRKAYEMGYSVDSVHTDSAGNVQLVFAVN